MKKLFLCVVAVFAFAETEAQTQFGLTAGYSNVSIKDGESGSGFNVGAFVDLIGSETFSVRPELVYTSSTIEDLSFNLFNVNVMAKYHVSEDFSVLAGPQIGFASGEIPDDLDELLGDDFTSLNFQLAVGASYDITDNIFAQARYGFQLNDHFTGDGDGEIKVNSFSVGIGYKF